MVIGNYKEKHPIDFSSQIFIFQNQGVTSDSSQILFAFESCLLWLQVRKGMHLVIKRKWFACITPDICKLSCLCNQWILHVEFDSLATCRLKSVPRSVAERKWLMWLGHSDQNDVKVNPFSFQFIYIPVSGIENIEKAAASFLGCEKQIHLNILWRTVVTRKRDRVTSEVFGEGFLDLKDIAGTEICKRSYTVQLRTQHLPCSWSDYMAICTLPDSFVFPNRVVPFVCSVFTN